METTVVVVLVIAALAFMIGKLRKAGRGGGCGCGCSGCHGKPKQL